MKLFGLEIIPARQINSLREDVTQLQRQLEDVGWVKINSTDWSFSEGVQEKYTDMVKRCRLAYLKNPIVGQAVNLTTYYTFGEGVMEPKCQESEEVNEIIKEFWNDPDNRLSLTSNENQLRLSNKLQYDGELAFIMQVDVDGTCYVRLIDTLSITTIVRDKMDGMRPLFYKRRINMRDQYIPDWSNGLALLREQESERWAAMLKDHGINDSDVVKNTYLYHVKVNNDILDQRGIPEVYRALDWVNSNLKINSDTATFINAQAQFAFKKKIKGSRSQVDAMVNRQRQNTNLTNPSYMAGSTHVSSEGVDLEAVNLQGSTGQLFETGIRRTLLMVCAGFGIMEHYFGDPSTGNLATSKSMELPMLKKFKARQKLWECIIKNILNFVLDMKLFAVSPQAFYFNDMKNRLTALENRDYSSREIDIDFPDILDTDIKQLAEALIAAKNAQLIPIETAQRMFMQELGIDDIEAEMSKEFYEPISQFTDPQNTPDNKKPPVKESVGDQTDAVKQARQHALKLAEKNKTVLSKLNGYKKELAFAFNQLVEGLKNDMTVHTTGGENIIAKLSNRDSHIQKFQSRMLEAARKYYPQVVGIAEKYVRGKTDLKESIRVFESRMNQFLDDQIQWNESYVKNSLIPAIRKKVNLIESESYPTEMAARAKMTDLTSMLESRVGKYVGALWTVDQRAVKEAAKGSGQKVNFIGVDDETTCEDCKSALEGGPYAVESAPVPGEQTCMTNCRHALQLIDDEPLTESDIELLREAEAEAKKGFKLLT